MKGIASLRLIALLAGASLSTAAFSTSLTGMVRDTAGKPTVNAFVTANNVARKMAVTVLTDKAGRYRIDDLFPGQYDMNARKIGFNDGVKANVELGDRDVGVDLKLEPDDFNHLSTPGAAWLQALPNVPQKAAFATNCTICHDQGSPLTHIVRDAATWDGIIKKMRGQHDSYSVIVQMDNGKLANWLAEQKFGSRHAAFDPFTKRANVANARITEYPVGDITSWLHDVAVDSRTGTVWLDDYARGELSSLDPRTGEQKLYPSPVSNVGGMHTLSFDRDGYLWITFQLVAKVARFDPRTAQWRVYEGFSPKSLVHSFATDSEGYVKKDAQGRIYVSQWGENHTSILDPSTGDLTEFTLPGSPTGKPYGIAVDSKGLIWYTKYSENILGYFDPVKKEGKEWELSRPDSGPHRMHIDDDDNLWIPLSGYGSLLKYNTRDGKQKEYKLPDADTFPYVSRYDAKSKRVWVSGNGANAIYAFDPKTEKFTTFRMPSILSYARVISIDYTTGDLWTALASYPNKLSLRDHGVVVRIHKALDLATK